MEGQPLKIAIIGGTGKLGYGLAKRFAYLGHDVMIGSRDKQKAESKAREINQTLNNSNVLGETVTEAAKWGEVVIIAVPYAGQHATVKEIQEHTTGKVVVDTTVPLTPGKPTEQRDSVTSVAEETAQYLGNETALVSGFHTISHTVLNDLDANIQSDVLLCGDDQQAIEVVSKLISELGGSPIHAGALKNARVLERLTPMIIGMNKRYKKKHIGVKMTGLN